MYLRFFLFTLIVFFSVLCCNNPGDVMSDEVYISIGSQIREQRLARGMKQLDLADSVGITQNGLSLIEDGMATPIHTKLILIQNFFDVEFKINGKYTKIEDYLRDSLHIE